MENKTKNLNYEIKGKKLIVEIDLDKVNKLSEADLSSSGKSYIVATTGGNIRLEGEYSYIALGVNCFASKDYIEGRKEIARQKAVFQADSKKQSELEKRLEEQAAEMAELKALLAAALKSSTPAQVTTEDKSKPATAKGK